MPKRILEKTGPLTDREWGVMRQHTLVGEEILSPVGELAQVGHLVRHSHERWDGTGYPDGLRGEGIPLGSRIIFCADTFHAIRSDRPYRPGRSADEALAEIRRCAGTQFDPTVANALEEVVRERRSRPRGARSSRLLALVMCLVIGGAGTALAHSDLLGESGGAPPSRAPAPPRGCGNVACSRVAAPVGGLGPVGALGSSPGPRALHPGLPGRLHGRIAGKLEHSNGASGHGESQPAKNDHPEKGNGRALGHSGESHGASQPTGATNAAVPSSSSHAGGSGGRGHHSGHSHHTSGGSSGGSHHTSGGNSGGSHHASGGSSGGSHGRGGSHGSHGSGGSNGASHGNSGKDGGSSGSHGK